MLSPLLSAQTTESTVKHDERKGVAVEYGTIKEISAGAKVYVETDDAESRQQIVKAIGKYPGLALVTNKDDSDFVLIFRIRKEITKTGSTINGRMVSFKKIIGEMVAIAKNNVVADGKTALKVLWSTRKVQEWEDEDMFTPNKYPAASAITQFIKDLKKSRGEKN